MGKFLLDNVRARFIPLAVLLSAVVLPFQALAAQPNILIINVDDLRGDAPSVVGDPDYAFSQTPNIDRIAQEGVRFTNSFVTHSLCSPSRATMLTGLYPHKHGVISIHYGLYGDQRDYLDTSIPTLPSILKQAGYETGFFGKWHLGQNYNRPEFDRWVAFAGQGIYNNPTLLVDDTTITRSGEHITPVLAGYLVDFINQERTAPFFAILADKAIHSPFVPPDHLVGVYDNVVISPPASWNEDISDKPAWYQQCALNRPPLTEASIDETMHKYFATLQGVDEAVGTVLAALEAKGILDDTVIIFTGDNGFMLGEHGRLDKRLAFEESLRVPMFIRYPAWFAPQTLVSNDMALNVDIAPTVLEAAGINPVTYGMQGVPLNRLGDTAKRKFFLYQYYLDGLSTTACIPTLRSIRRMNYKYVAYYVEGTDDQPPFEEELYNLATDPLELENIIGQAGTEGILASLKTQMRRLRIDLGDTQDTFAPPP